MLTHDRKTLFTNLAQDNCSGPGYSLHGAVLGVHAKARNRTLDFSRMHKTCVLMDVYKAPVHGWQGKSPIDSGEFRNSQPCLTTGSGG